MSLVRVKLLILWILVTPEFEVNSLEFQILVNSFIVTRLLQIIQHLKG